MYIYFSLKNYHPVCLLGIKIKNFKRSSRYFKLIKYSSLFGSLEYSSVCLHFDERGAGHEA